MVRACQPTRQSCFRRLSRSRIRSGRSRIKGMHLVNRLFAVVSVLCLWLAPLSGQPSTRSLSTSVEIVRDLLRSLWAFDQEGRPSTSRQVGFQLPESVVNTYLAASLASNPRPMIDSLQVRLLSENRCVVDAIINFDDLQTREPALFSRSERKQFSGSKSVRAEFHFSLSSGYLTFEAKPLESQVTPPHSLLMKMIQLIAAGQPERIDTTRKIPVPFGLKLWTTEGVLHGDT